MTTKRLLLRTAMAGRRHVQPALRRLHQVTLRLRGYGVGSGDDSGEQHLMRSLSNGFGEAVIFDIGANRGKWSVAAHEAWPRATIHAFEPSAEMFAELTQRTAGLPVQRVKAALSDKPGTSTLYAVPGHPNFSSLTRRDLQEHDLAMTDGETIDVTTLDHYCTQNSVSHIDFLKIDVEGHEMDVLRGASGLLEAGAVDRIQFEFGGANIDTRTYLRDFVRLLSPDFGLFRLLADGLEPLVYSEREEIFAMANFLAVARRLDDGSRAKP